MRKRLKKYILNTALLTVAAYLGSCTSGNFVPTEPDPTPIMITSGGGSFSIEVYSRGEGSRAVVDPESYTPVLPGTLGVYGEMEHFYMGHIFDEEVMFYNTKSDDYGQVQDALEAVWPADFEWPSSNDWAYAPLKYWTEGGKYQFYCYAPHYMSNNTKPTLDQATYGLLKGFKLENIPPYSNEALMISDRFKEDSIGTVKFNMVPLSARMCIRFKIGESYSRIRKVKVTEVSIGDRRDDGEYYMVESQFTNDADDFSVEVKSQGLAYNPPTSDPNIHLIRIFNDSTGLELEKDAYKQFGSLYAMPQMIPSITINVTYDVYDTDNKLVRKDQKVSNTHVLRRTVESGKYYDVNILISPAYLYVLSDTDGERCDVLLDIPE